MDNWSTMQNVYKSLTKQAATIFCPNAYVGELRITFGRFRTHADSASTSVGCNLLHVVSVSQSRGARHIGDGFAS